MTTIAAFATFTAPHDDLKNKSLSSVYLISDSKWSWVQRNKIVFAQENGQKIFYSKEEKTIVAYSGDAEVGIKICNGLISTISTNAKIRAAKSIDEKISVIHQVLNGLLNKIPQEKRLADIEIILVTNICNNIYLYSFYSNSTDKEFAIHNKQIKNTTEIYCSGSGKKQFESELSKNREHNPEVNDSAIFFNSFIKFLKANIDPMSALPCQAVVMNLKGEIKLVSIKHKDGFYKLGNIDNERANFKFEVDFRDEEFEFLNADGTIKGKNRKHYHFKK